MSEHQRLQAAGNELLRLSGAAVITLGALTTGFAVAELGTGLYEHHQTIINYCDEYLATDPARPSVCNAGAQSKADFELGWQLAGDAVVLLASGAAGYSLGRRRQQAPYSPSIRRMPLLRSTFNRHLARLLDEGADATELHENP